MPWLVPGRCGGADRDDLSVWVDSARGGDSDAFGRIWQMLSPRVNGYLRARGVAACEDVTSEVFLAAFTSLGSFSGDGSCFRSWLFTIAHRKAIDAFRRCGETSHYTTESDPRVSASAEQDALDATLDADVARILSALTPEQREVLLLRALGDLSVEQVAAATGRSTAAVKQLHHRAVLAARRAAEAGGVPQRSGAAVTAAAPRTVVEA